MTPTLSLLFRGTECRQGIFELTCRKGKTGRQKLLGLFESLLENGGLYPKILKWDLLEEDVTFFHVEYYSLVTLFVTETN